MMQTLAEGWWCTKCETFEDDDTSMPINGEGVCTNCGCDGIEHRRAEVVSAGLS